MATTVDRCEACGAEPGANRRRPGTGVRTAVGVQLDELFSIVALRDASDLHLRAGSAPRIRVDGVLDVVPDQPVLDEADTELLAAALMRPDVRARFAERGEADFAVASDEGLRFRASVYRQRGSAAIVLRRVATEPRSIADLGLPDVVGTLADEQRGLVVVTGPTGSGKTTTVAAMIDRINRSRPVHVVTIEDPIEIVHSDRVASISQREVGADTPDFASAMRVALRQDPDVVFVGEMRDKETVQAALSAAETGHLVLSTLHTLDATETVNRIIEFFPPAQQRQMRGQLAGTLKGTIGQRLVPTADGLGRVPAVEVMVANGRVRHCLTTDDTKEQLADIIADGSYYGMQSFDQSLATLFANGTISLRDALDAATNPHDLKVNLRRQGLLTK